MNNVKKASCRKRITRPHVHSILGVTYQLKQSGHLVPLWRWIRRLLD